MFIGRNEAEAPILWPLYAESQVSGKDLMLGKTEGKRKRGWKRMRWLDSIIASLDMNVSKHQETVEDRGACVLQSSKLHATGCKESDKT